jgi:hypothetical protein
MLDDMRNADNIVGLSGGKDSVATAILMRWLGIPFETITAEVFWKEGVSADNPYHAAFMSDTLYPRLEQWGVITNKVKSSVTAYGYMTTPISKSEHPERVGKLRGFPLCGKCGIQRDCKTRPCEKFYKERRVSKPIFGFASDEKDRIVACKNSISILDILGLDEWVAFPIASREGLLSPSYEFTNRGGCFFCPNQKIQEWEVLYYDFPQLWSELKEVQDMPNKVQEKITRTKTLYDIEREIKGGVQIRIFMPDLLKKGANNEQN